MNCSEGNVRLRFGANETIGTVEVCADGFWGTICYNLWDSRDADVVCRQLGFQTFGNEEDMGDLCIDIVLRVCSMQVQFHTLTAILVVPVDP